MTTVSVTTVSMLVRCFACALLALGYLFTTSCSIQAGIYVAAAEAGECGGDVGETDDLDDRDADGDEDGVNASAADGGAGHRARRARGTPPAPRLPSGRRRLLRRPPRT